MEAKTKNIIIGVSFSVVILILIGIIVFMIIDFNTIKGDKSKAKNAIIGRDEAIIRIGNKDINIAKGERVGILQEDILNNEYIVKYNDEIGKIDREDVIYYDINKFVKNNKYSLMVDVSKFNIVGQENDDNPNRNFNDEKEFELFLLNKDIQYVYIRLRWKRMGRTRNMVL